MSSTAHLRSQIGAIFEMGVGTPPQLQTLRNGVSTMSGSMRRKLEFNEINKIKFKKRHES